MGAQFSQVQSPQSSQPSGKGNIAPNLYAVHKGSNTEAALGENGLFSKTFPNESALNTPVPTEFNRQPDIPPQGQSDGIARPMGKGGRITYPGQDGQPQMGKPNQYSNTVGPWDNANIQHRTQSGKGKGY